MEFTESQLRELEYGREVGLTHEQINLYRSPEFDEDQMEALRIVLMKGANYEVLKAYCNPTYAAQLLKIIGWAVKNNFTAKEIHNIIESDDPFDEYENFLVQKGL